jgi:peptidoglycan glycosyltransferase
MQRLAMERLGDRAGAVVVLRPQDGAVRVLASTPSFDPNRVDANMFLRADPRARLLNRATAGLYPPGSTFKVVIAADALDRGFSRPHRLPGRRLDHLRALPQDPRPRILRGAPRRAQLARPRAHRPQRGAERVLQRLLRPARRVPRPRRLPRPRGASCSTAASASAPATPASSTMRTGRIPRIPSSDRYGLAQASIGQGKVLVTPAQMALIAAAVANDGVAVQPRLVPASSPPPPGASCSPAPPAKLRAMMRRAVTEGTGRGIETPGLAIAGKTGTAENPFGASHSWFIGFAPADRPALAVAVLVEHGGYGSTVAAPIARDLLLLAKERGHLP